MKNTFCDENVKKSNHAPRRAHDLISGEKPISWLFDENVKKSNHAPRRAHDLISGGKAEFLVPPQPRVGDDDDDGDGRIFPEHPRPILHAPRDIISRKGKSLTPIYIYREREREREIMGESD